MASRTRIIALPGQGWGTGRFVTVSGDEKDSRTRAFWVLGRSAEDIVVAVELVGLVQID